MPHTLKITLPKHIHIRRFIWRYRWMLLIAVCTLAALNAAPSIIHAIRGTHTSVACRAQSTPTGGQPSRPASAIDLVPPGMVAAPAHFADPEFSKLLHPGDRVDILAASGTTKDGKVVPAEPWSNGLLSFKAPQRIQKAPSCSP